ncbi:MAG: hypothetical protein JRH20_25315, partial [Deltaproteobacteria bacterium]|nr:hypothetical protein [Deltaproteobacteria bacterium]
MSSQKRQENKISTDATAEDSLEMITGDSLDEVRIDVEPPPGMALAPEDQETRQIDTKPLVDAAFDDDDVDPSEELGLDRPLFKEAGVESPPAESPPADSTPEHIAKVVRSARAHQSTPDIRRGPKAHSQLPPEDAFGPSVVVTPQIEPTRGDQSDPTVPRVTQPNHRRRHLPTGPHMPQAGSARRSGERRPLTEASPWLPPVEPSSTPRYVFFLVGGALTGILLGVGVGVWHNQNKTSVPKVNANTSATHLPAATPGAATPGAETPGAETQPADAAVQDDPSAHPLAIPGSMVQLQRRLKLIPKELEQLTFIRKMLGARHWQQAETAFSQLSVALQQAPEIGLWRAHIDLFRGRAKEAKQGCDKLFEGALPTTWIGEVGLTLAKAE